MPRKKYDVKEDLMVLCSRCNGDGNIGTRNGQRVACPACGGEGRAHRADLLTFNNLTERRVEAYASDIDYSLGAGREGTTVDIDRLQATSNFVNAALRGETGGDAAAATGRVLVRPVAGGSRQEFEVIAGHAALAEALRTGQQAISVEVDATETTRGIGDPVDLRTFQPGGGS